MAEKKPNATLRPIQGLPRSATPSGVIHVRTYHSGQYVVVGNHLAQHRELSLTAIGLATHILSVPEGTPVDIRTLAERFPEGRDRIAAALRELESHGYLRRVREHTQSGRLVTRTYVHHTPATAPQAEAPAPLRVAGRSPAGGRPPITPTDERSAPEEDDRTVPGPTPASQPERAEAVTPAPETSEPVTPGPETPATDPSSLRDPRYGKAAALLAGLRRSDDRLILSQRDVHRLAPAVTAWFDAGASPAVIHHALTDNLPGDLRNPARLIGYRLAALLPVPLPARPAPAPIGAVDSRAARRPLPLQNCDGCDRAFRAPQPGRCRDCRTGRAAAGEPAWAA
jgi:hypothetical protein